MKEIMLLLNPATVFNAAAYYATKDTKYIAYSGISLLLAGGYNFMNSVTMKFDGKVIYNDTRQSSLEKWCNTEDKDGHATGNRLAGSLSFAYGTAAAIPLMLVAKHLYTRFNLNMIPSKYFDIAVNSALSTIFMTYLSSNPVYGESHGSTKNAQWFFRAGKNMACEFLDSHPLLAPIQNPFLRNGIIEGITAPVMPEEPNAPDNTINSLGRGFAVGASVTGALECLKFGLSAASKIHPAAEMACTLSQPFLERITMYITESLVFSGNERFGLSF